MGCIVHGVIRSWTQLATFTFTLGKFRKDVLVYICSCEWVSVTNIKQGFRRAGSQWHFWHQVDDLGQPPPCSVFSFVMWQSSATCSPSSPLILTVNHRRSWALKQISIWSLDSASKEVSVTIWENFRDNFHKISRVILVQYHISPKFFFISKLVHTVHWWGKPLPKNMLITLRD